MLISEIFTSVQGEGRFTGQPSTFIRTSGCNLRCIWCDTPHTSWHPQGEVVAVDEVLEAVRSREDVPHVVVTGGEPMLQNDLPSLVRALRDQGRFVTIETSGTHHDPALHADLFSISPKLTSSTPDASRPGARRIHLRNNSWELLSRYVEGGMDYQIKFVVCRPDDAVEIGSVVSAFRIPAHRVYLMPEGRSSIEMEARAPMVRELSRRLGFNFSDRLHIRRWGNRQGT